MAFCGQGARAFGHRTAKTFLLVGFGHVRFFSPKPQIASRRMTGSVKECAKPETGVGHGHAPRTKEVLWCRSDQILKQGMAIEMDPFPSWPICILRSSARKSPASAFHGGMSAGFLGNHRWQTMAMELCEGLTVKHLQAKSSALTDFLDRH